jgi:hypothetical protein
MNEPFGYSASQWESIASTWLSDFSSVPHSRYPTWASYTDEALAQPRASGCSAPQGGDRSVASYAPMESAAPSVRTSPRVIMPSSLRR